MLNGQESKNNYMNGLKMKIGYNRGNSTDDRSKELDNKEEEICLPILNLNQPKGYFNITQTNEFRRRENLSIKDQLQPIVFRKKAYYKTPNSQEE